MINDDFARIYRETVGRAEDVGITRQDAFEEAEASILTEIKAGRLNLDVASAVRAQLQDIDKRDGKSADRVLKSLAGGALPLDGMDLELVVTLGGGMRKQWGFINANDLRRMDDLRFQNVAAAQEAYKQWRASYSIVLPVLFAYANVAAAHDAGAFPETVAAPKAGAA